MKTDPRLDQVPYMKGNRMIWGLGKPRKFWVMIREWWNKK